MSTSEIVRGYRSDYAFNRIWSIWEINSYKVQFIRIQLVGYTLRQSCAFHLRTYALNHDDSAHQHTFRIENPRTLETSALMNSFFSKNQNNDLRLFLCLCFGLFLPFLDLRIFRLVFALYTLHFSCSVASDLDVFLYFLLFCLPRAIIPIYREVCWCCYYCK